MNKLFILSVILIISTVAASTCNFTLDNKCGPKNGNKVCWQGQYCSKEGDCGPFFKKKNPQVAFSDAHGCEGEMPKLPSNLTCAVSLNNRCGAKRGGLVCWKGQHCSKGGWCNTAKKLKKHNKKYSNANGCFNNINAAPVPATQNPDFACTMSNNGKCGPDHGSSVCANNWCRPDGTCGELGGQPEIFWMFSNGHCDRGPDIARSPAPEEPAPEEPAPEEPVSSSPSPGNVCTMSNNGKCGPDHGNTICANNWCRPDGTCGELGGQPDIFYMFSNGYCDRGFPAPSQTPEEPVSSSPSPGNVCFMSNNGKCGPDHGNTICANNWCRPDGTCGELGGQP